MSEPLLPILGKAFEPFIIDRQARRYTAATLSFYRFHLAPFLTWCDERNARTLAEISPMLSRAYMVHLQARDLSDWTVNGTARAIRALLNFCVAEGLLSASPMTRVRMPKIDKRILPAFEPQDVEHLLDACEHDRDRAVILFLLDTGIHSSEFVALNGSDIDAAGGTVIIRQGKERKHRTVYLGAKARRALLRYWRTCDRPGIRDPAWRSLHTSRRLTDSGLRQLLRRVAKRAGIKYCHPHTFRRTFALWSLRSGMSFYHLQRLMGHEGITVLKQYLALVETDLQQAHRKYGAVDTFLK